MTTLLLLDDATPINELLARELTEQLGYEVTAMRSIEELFASKTLGFDVALVDLSFPGSAHTGLDALLFLHEHSATTRLVVLTQGDDWVADMLRDAWEALPLAGAMSKSAPLSTLVPAIRHLADRDGQPLVDPVLAPLLPSVRSPWRSLAGYARLVQHAGHAKLWRALIQSPTEPSYRDLADTTGLSVNTVRNYREQLLGELALHGLENPSMRDMQGFARRCRPFLDPQIEARLAGRRRSAT